MPQSPAPLPLAALGNGHLRTPDLILIAVYLLAITLFGLRFRSKGQDGKPDRSLKSYFLASNTIPWWAIALSVVSAETSTLTIISIPGVAFAGNFGFLQLVLGYLVGRVVVAFLFLPRYFAGEMLTAYQLIDRRFGPILHKVTAGLFLLTRAAAEGVRVFAVSIVVGIAIGTNDILSIAIISALTLLYTFEGGMAAVIWTDVVQMVIYIGGTVVALITLGHHVPGGWPTILHTASAAGKLHMFNFAFNLTQSYTFWAGLLGGTFLTMASHGTDQLMVQRLLAARNLRESQTALLSSGVVIFFQFAFFLLIGAGLWVFYGHLLGPHAAAAFRTNDYIFPTYIVREMPVGIAGLLVAAILAAAMSNLSAALNSLSSTTVVDFYLRFRQPTRAPNLRDNDRVPHLRDGSIVANGGETPQTPDESPVSDRERLLVSKASTALWAIVLFAIAVYSIKAGGKGHVVEIGLSIAAVAYGCLLGVFLLGTLTRFATEYGATIGMICGFALNLWLWQGTFPVHVGFYHQFALCRTSEACPPAAFVGITIPHIAFTWYVLIGAIVTFAIGSLASLVLRTLSRTKPTAVTSAALLLFLLSFPKGICVPQAQAQTPGAPSPRPASSGAKVGSTDADFSLVSQLITTAIAQQKLPGAVVLIGHNGHIVFERAYGNRKLAGEPGLNGQPSPAEPMTEDTIFDMASLSKNLVTSLAIGQLYGAGKLDFDTPVDHYLPDFNPTDDPTRAKVTLRLLLTHFSGEPPDVNLKDPWGLGHPEKAEGIHRALTTPLASTPGTKFVYSDINFILLGTIVEKLSGERLDDYAREHIFQPLGMQDTRYLPFDRAWGADTLGAAIIGGSKTKSRPMNRWMVQGLIDQTAPTAHDDEGTPETNPDFNHLLRGTVDDPTTRRMGGVAGHAGVFSTAHDASLFAQALLDKLLRNTGPFPLKQSTLQLMTTPEQPGHSPGQLEAANAAEQAELAARLTQEVSSRPDANPTIEVSSRPEREARSGETRSSLAAPQSPSAGTPISDPLLAPSYPAIKSQVLRGFGWDIDSAFSKPRGRLFPIGSFGHTGFTGTSLWIDPASNTYVILLANSIHPHVKTPISNLRGEVATAAAQALGLYAPQSAPRPNVSASTDVSSRPRLTSVSAVERPVGLDVSAATDPGAPPSRPASSGAKVGAPAQIRGAATQTGLDVLESTHYAALTEASKDHNNQLRLGLLTNQTGIDSHNRRTVDILYTDLPKILPQAHLTTLFSPEHGIFGQQDTEHLSTQTDPTTGLHVTSLYGPHDSDKRPSHDQLKDLDAVIIDLQDAGVRCYTYETVVGYFLEAAAHERTTYNHPLEIIVLDRPDPVGGDQIGGPISDPGTEYYANYMPIPLRHGLTLGELARYINTTKHLNANLTVVRMQHWSRSEYFTDTGLPFTPPSPNLRTPTAETLYPATAFVEMTNLSVGRGTEAAFELFGAGIPATPGAHLGAPSSPTASSSAKVGAPAGAPAQPQPWFHAQEVAQALNARQIPGVRFEATRIPVAEDTNHYPFHGQTIEAVRLILTDRNTLDTSELGLELLSTLHKLYPTQFQLEKAMRLVASRATIDAVARGDDPRAIAASWHRALDRFRQERQSSLLY